VGPVRGDQAVRWREPLCTHHQRQSLLDLHTLNGSSGETCDVCGLAKPDRNRFKYKGFRTAADPQSGEVPFVSFTDPNQCWRSPSRLHDYECNDLIGEASTCRHCGQAYAADPPFDPGDFRF
jgi:hypothetical protein